ncbi:hypothetical protein HIM_07771 [Hirsutella minnesotensis 3608]|uniref:Uncharacterized protein n=1 Tax=Hirsutella minnesotensis 3608 TaxID=1043627 RepID=A0A0F7ZYP4_9HYPO|nr:hypothetical protein HIM_07771 [Hirsutella minnesotensis 3608]
MEDGWRSSAHGDQHLSDDADFTPQSNVDPDADLEHIPTPLSDSTAPTSTHASQDACSLDEEPTFTRRPRPFSLYYSASSIDQSEPSLQAITRRKRPESLMMALTGDKPADDSRPARSTTWFSPRSPAAVERAAAADATSRKTRGNQGPASTPVSPGRPKVASPSRFSFFTSPRITALKTAVSSSPSSPQDDELINLDVDAALFPTGTPADGDAFSPAAFKNLHMNATGLLRRFQIAYKQRVTTVHELKADLEAHQDEKSENETRIRHLKMQLEDMARKAAENEDAMRTLVEELTKEKKLRMRERNLSAVSEDLGVEEDQLRMARRRSGGTTKSDSGFDTDEDSIEEASVFSRCRSPTLTASTVDVTSLENMPPPPPPPSHTKPPMPSPTRTSRQPPPQMSTIQKLFKGMGSEAPGQEDAHGLDRCRNCHGQDASVAWDTVGLLRDENRSLKQRMGDLETAVEDALDAVNGIRL